MLSLAERIELIAQNCEKILSHFKVSGNLEWCCIFCQSEEEYISFNKVAAKLGPILEETSSGPIYRLKKPLQLAQGTITFLKVREVDSTRPELGDCDYAASDWQKTFFLAEGKSGFAVIERPKFKMIELMTLGVPARVYFSNPTMSQVYK